MKKKGFFRWKPVLIYIFFMEIQTGHNVFDGNPNTQMMWGMQPPLPTYYTCSSDMWNKNHLVTECVEQGMNQLLCDEHLSQQQYKLNVWINRVYAIRIATAFWAEQPNILSQMRYCATNKSAFYSAIAEKWHFIVKTIFTWFRTKAPTSKMTAEQSTTDRYDFKQYYTK